MLSAVIGSSSSGCQPRLSTTDTEAGARLPCHPDLNTKGVKNISWNTVLVESVFSTFNVSRSLHLKFKRMSVKIIADGHFGWLKHLSNYWVPISGGETKYCENFFDNFSKYRELSSSGKYH